MDFIIKQLKNNSKVIALIMTACILSGRTCRLRPF